MIYGRSNTRVNFIYGRNNTRVNVIYGRSAVQGLM